MVRNLREIQHSKILLKFKKPFHFPYNCDREKFIFQTLTSPGIQIINLIDEVRYSFQYRINIFLIFEVWRLISETCGCVKILI